jgi:hypothetical protein
MTFLRIVIPLQLYCGSMIFPKTGITFRDHALAFRLEAASPCSSRAVNKWTFGIVATHAGAGEQLIHYIKTPPRLPFQLFADGSRIFTPGLEIATERMDQHYAFRLIRFGLLPPAEAPRA